MHVKYLNLKDFCEFHWAFVLQHLSTIPLSFGIPHLPLFQVVTASEDHIVIPSRVTRLMDVGDRTRRSCADLKRLWACYQVVSVSQTSVVVNLRVSDVMIYCHAFFNHSNVISCPFQNFTTCCHLKCSWWSWGLPFGLKKPTIGKPRKPSPLPSQRTTSAWSLWRRLVWPGCLRLVGIWLDFDVPHFLDSSKSQICTLHESITSALRLQVTYFATAVATATSLAASRRNALHSFWAPQRRWHRQW